MNAECSAECGAVLSWPLGEEWLRCEACGTLNYCPGGMVPAVPPGTAGNGGRYCRPVTVLPVPRHCRVLLPGRYRPDLRQYRPVTRNCYPVTPPRYRPCVTRYRGGTGVTRYRPPVPR